MGHWQALAEAIGYQLESHSLTMPEKDWDSLAGSLGLPGLPPSYVAYHAFFGYGLWGDEFLILPPRGPDVCTTLASFALDEWPEYSTGFAAAEDLLVFALLPNECYLAWRRSGLAAGVEATVYVVDVDYGQLLPAATAVDDFLWHQWVGQGLDRTYPIQGSWFSGSKDHRFTSLADDKNQAF